MRCARCRWNQLACRLCTCRRWAAHLHTLSKGHLSAACSSFVGPDFVRWLAAHRRRESHDSCVVVEDGP